MGAVFLVCKKKKPRRASLFLLRVEFDDNSVILWFHSFLDGVAVAVFVNETAVTCFLTANVDGVAGDVTAVAPFRVYCHACSPCLCSHVFLRL